MPFRINNPKLAPSFQGCDEHLLLHFSTWGPGVPCWGGPGHWRAQDGETPKAEPGDLCKSVAWPWPHPSGTPTPGPVLICGSGAGMDGLLISTGWAKAPQAPVSSGKGVKQRKQNWGYYQLCDHLHTALFSSPAQALVSSSVTWREACLPQLSPTEPGGWQVDINSAIFLEGCPVCRDGANFFCFSRLGRRSPLLTSLQLFNFVDLPATE